ncbi:bifunctional 2-polyprenyl-6-hydroxyphenol methylase/3-demethylubiquinol 3-O-methyltransferase UbiG [Aliikangiella sp. IMCC44359]|uniref:bifunctional 2-polyprenyl-6-hydroxyphenol methylase/3-demethylubiquinol 3-O-methyltransferase UbiG n=1 Tax=Aliikangiella sp. IMCC44359 TaxID=3459125 RepID=UPI00403AF20F
MTTTQNVDAAEIKKFSDLASRWWDKESEFKPLHDINPLRLAYIEKYTQGLANKKVIDVGCGGGILADSMSASGATVTGIDMGEAPLSVAKLHQLESGQNVTYRQITAEEIAQEHPAEFDLVTCMEMIEHVPDPASVVMACAQLVKPGGDLFFSTINRTAKAFAFAIIGAEYLLKMLPKGTHQYEKFVKPSELAHWSRQAGLEMQNIIGMHYNPLSKIYKLDKGVDVNYIVHFKRVN